MQLAFLTIKWALPAQVQVLLVTSLLPRRGMSVSSLHCHFSAFLQKRFFLVSNDKEQQSLLLLLLLLFPLCHFHILRLPLCAFRILNAMNLARFRTSKSFVRHTNAIIL